MAGFECTVLQSSNTALIIVVAASVRPFADFFFLC